MAKECDRKGCFMYAQWQPAFLLWADGCHGTPILAVLNLKICELHKRTMDLKEFLPDMDDTTSWDWMVAKAKSQGVNIERRLVMLTFVVFEEMDDE